jgi:hypothetical protein
MEGRNRSGVASEQGLASQLQFQSPSANQGRPQETQRNPTRRKTMLRNTLFGISMLALTTGSAFAATAKHQVAAKPHVVAQSDSATPSTDKPAKKSTKKTTKKSTKTDAAKGEGSKEMKAPAPEAK